MKLPIERKKFVFFFSSVDRASLECTIQQVSLPLESVLVDPMPKDVLPLADARKMDLEMAVIMQVSTATFYCIQGFDIQLLSSLKENLLN